MNSFYKQRGTMGGNLIQTYVERRMDNIHNASASSVTIYKEKMISILCGTFVLVILPYIHIGKIVFQCEHIGKRIVSQISDFQFFLQILFTRVLFKPILIIIELYINTYKSHKNTLSTVLTKATFL